MRLNANRIRMIGLATAVPLIAVACGGSGGGSAATANPAKLANSCPASAGLGTKVNDQGIAVATSAAISAQANDSFFLPTCTTKVPAGVVTYTVRNFGASLHNVSIPEQGIDRDVEPGASVTVNVTVGTSPVKFFCKYHKSSGMVGALLPGS